MSNYHVPRTAGTTYPPVIEGELVDLDALFELDVHTAPDALLYPPAVRPLCACGKDGTLRSHGGLTCGQVMAERARIEAVERRVHLNRRCRTAGVIAAGIAGAAAAAGAVWLIVMAVIAVVAGIAAAVAAVVAWIAAYWVVILVVLVLLCGGGAKCAGLHCGGCSG